MRVKYKIGLMALAVIGIMVATGFWLHGRNVEVLNPAGSIAMQERHLLMITTVLSALVVVPVFILLAFIVWRYREENAHQKHVRYTPDWDGNRLLESVWWGIPIVLIGIVMVLIWTSAHNLDPYKSITSGNKTMTIQVVALDWKWLFIYPDQHIASVNFVQMPLNTPVDFQITSDAPMNSFWIPQLGGQVYAMSGMQTHMHLIANKLGDYNGVSANISGEGFADMKFTARASSAADFSTWVQSVKKAGGNLTTEQYARLAKPSTAPGILQYGTVSPNLYDTIIEKYMGPIHVHTHGDAE